MELHHFTLQRQVKILRKKILGSTIEASFTQKKNEQILHFKNATGKFIEVVLSTAPEYPFLIFRDPSKRSKNSTDVMPELIGQKIQGISLLSGERVVVLDFQNKSFSLYLQFFRNKTNFFFVRKHREIMSAFKKNKKYSGTYFQMKPNVLWDPMNLNSNLFVNNVKEHQRLPLDHILRRYFLYLTPIMIQEIAIRSKLQLNKLITSYRPEELKAVFRTIITLLNSCENDEPRVYLENGYPIALTLTNFEQFSGIPYETFSGVNEALIFYIFTRAKLDRYIKKKAKLEKVVNQKLAHLHGLKANLQNMPDEHKQREYFKKIGELIFAQLPNLPEGKSEIEIIDLYMPKQPVLKVKVDPNLSLQQNANHYFRKSKEVSERRRSVKQKLSRIESQYKQLKSIQVIFENDLDYHELNKIEKKLIGMHILQTDDKKLEAVYLPYKQQFYKTWEIWIGKNARANDKMTFGLAHKEDIWLHAQGVTGSHVLIKIKSDKAGVPHEVVEYAAQIAATNSKAKFSTYVPVIYTKVKYLRKPRKSLPGTVLAERIKTIFVEPM